MRNNGFLLADVMIAAMVLALMVGSVAGAMAAQAAARARAVVRNDIARCFDEAVALAAADSALLAGVCGEVQWRIRRDGEKEVWVGSVRRVDEIVLPLPPR
jgi:hypothetical protein